LSSVSEPVLCDGGEGGVMSKMYGCEEGSCEMIEEG
jgi:hypothetical protein